MAVFAPHLRGRVPEEISVAHLHELNLILFRKVDYLEQIHHSVLQVRHLESHQIVKPSCLHHLLDLSGKLEEFGVTLVHANMIEQVVEDIADHLNLLLGLEIVVDLTNSLVTVDLCASVVFNTS